jgi:hypothetical protein
MYKSLVKEEKPFECKENGMGKNTDISSKTQKLQKGKEKIT